MESAQERHPIGWDQSFDHIIAPLTVTAQYIINYNIFFLSYDGTLLKEESGPATDVQHIVPTDGTQKIIRDGQVYILQNDQIYTVTGQKVRF